jgi:hypothetical protein
LRVFERLLHPPAEFFIIRSELFKFFVTPERIEGPTEALNNMWRLDLAQFDGPFYTVLKCRPRQIGGTDIGTTESVVALEKPCLCMETTAAAVERNPDLNIR